MTRSEAAITTDEQMDWCPTCGQRVTPYRWEQVGPVELCAIQSAIADAPPAPPDARRVQAKQNNTFTRNVSEFNPCGHAYRWRDTAAWFFNASDISDEVCAICLPDQIERGEAVVVNPEEIDRVIAWENELIDSGDPFQAVTGFYETWLYTFGESEETCGHEHATLQDAWACARTFNADDPFDVVWVHDGIVLYSCRREEEPAA